MDKNIRQVVVIGGGASGLMAAIAAARQGAKVTLLEKNRQTGKKLLATGNGRCNFTNKNQGLSQYRSEDPKFVGEALHAFSMQDTVRFFEELGLVVKDRQGWLYPNSGQASSVADLLRLETERLVVKRACNTRVISVRKKGDTFIVKSEGWIYEADAVILACGSKAAPDTGSTGDGYRFAEKFGHRIVPPLPALTGLYVAEQDCAKLSGIRQEAGISLRIADAAADGRTGMAWILEEQGEVQFTSYGLSGIPVFQVSRYAGRALFEGKYCEICLDLLPSWTEAKIVRVLKERQIYAGERSGADALLGIFPEKLCRFLLGRAGIPLQKKRRDWTEEDYARTAAAIKKVHFTVTRVRGYEQAQVCSGGVPLHELKGISMESSLVPGLYFAGELLDVDGACGGYNLQWAWTSGYLAGFHAAGGNRDTD